jgi:lipoprotein-anchoring transpeptidase ErfK/SrfK
MYFSSFFIGGFAIHGYSSVPPYPASHGCVRVPIWVAVRLYELASYGYEVDVYL